MKPRYICYALALLIAFSCLGCTKAGISHNVIYKDGKEYMKVAWQTDKEGAVVPLGYDHPQTLTTDEFKTILMSVEFQEYAFFKWRKPKVLFLEAEVERLAPQLAETFAGMTADQWIDFASVARKRDYLWPTPRITDGRMYFADGKLNIVIGNLNYEAIEYEDRNAGDPRKIYNIDSYRLVTKSALTVPAVVKGDAYLGREHSNWLVIDVAAVLGAMKEAPPVEPIVEEQGETAVEPAPDLHAPTDVMVPVAPPVETQRGVKERLQELQELLDEGLITQEEYDLKKKEILGDL